MSTKEGYTRKQEFLDTALELFYYKGFEYTTINNIIDEVGVSKGAFYHYFDSKEAVLEAIARDYVERKLEIVEKVSCEKNLNALEKFNKLVSDILDFKMQCSEMRWKIYKVIIRNNNIKLQNQIQENFLELVLPIYKKIIKQGVAEGIIHTEYPEEVAELYIYFSNIINKMIFDSLIKQESDLDNIEEFIKRIKEPENIKIIKAKFSFFENVLEKILGVKGGSINPTESILKQLIHQK